MKDLQKRDLCDPNRQMVKGSVKEGLESGQPSLNYLDLPSPAGVNAPNFLKYVMIAFQLRVLMGNRLLALDPLAGQIPVGIEYPHCSTKWQLLATAPALSHPHIDAGKFATWVHVRRGAKIWAVLDGPIPAEPLTEMDLAVHKWIPFLLEEGDML
jgi:hypothetical protein